MTQWIFFGILLIVGLGMLGSGLYYLRKEREDAESVKVYRVIALIGAVLAIGAVAYKLFV